MLTTANLPELVPGRVRQYAAPATNPHGDRIAAFTVEAGGEALAEVQVQPALGRTAEALELANVLYALLNGAEGRTADAEQRCANLRHALEQRRRELAELQRKLADFEVSRTVRGEFFAVETPAGVWLCGRPSHGAWGMLYAGGWGELARELPGLRPCGTVAAEGDTYVVMRPVADLPGWRSPPAEESDGTPSVAP